MNCEKVGVGLRISNLFSKTLLNERGMGIVGVMVAAALVVVAALTVASFVTDQWRQSMRLEISGSCQNIANSIVEYIKKDDNSLFISSFGSRNEGLPSSSAPEFPVGLASNDDGIDRFRFVSSSPVSIFSGTGAPMTATGTLNTTWSYYNHLNLRNSANRLIALAASGNYCCADLNMNDPSCGDEFYSNTMTRPGFTITDRNVDVVLAANVVNAAGTSACTGRTLLTSNIPNSRNGLPIDFKVRVTINRDQDNQRICEASGRVQRNTDVDAPLTVLQYENNFCAWGGSTPSSCTASGGVPIRIRVKTVRNGSGTSCQSSCLGGISSQRCTDISPGELSLFNSLSHVSCGAGNCPDSDPGSMFLCKIGEKQWAMTNNNLADPNVWQPCETATVKDYDGTAIPGAVVEIRHDPVINNPAQSERTTEAVITLNGLIPERSYVVDVRAVDTAGNVGPGFCDNSPSCNDDMPHFVLVSAPPAPGPITDNSMRVTASSQSGQIGRDNSLTSIPRYSSIMGSFTGTYQCENGSPFFQTISMASPSGAYPASADDCTATYTDANGVDSNPYCPCTAGRCTAVMANPVNQSGNHNIRMDLVNVCGSAAAVNLPWCMDNNLNIGITANAQGTMGSIPSFSGHINYPTTNPAGAKACGVLTLCPRVDGNFTPQVRINNAGGLCGTPADWNANSHSGCLASPTNNLCTVVVDPCGRYENSGSAAAAAASQYATLLATGGGTSNLCYALGGSPVGGNMCEGGSGLPVCTLGGKCAASCARQGAACSIDEDCQDNSLGAAHNQGDGPKCSSGSCTCGTNKLTQVRALGSCGPQYCPELNSCNGVDISNTASGGQACTSYNHWNMGAWGACTEVSPGVFQETRSVTCSGSDCSGYPQPPTTRPCPSCGSAVGGTYTLGSFSNKCDSGAASAATLSGSTWNWSCSLDGRTVYCSANYVPPCNCSVNTACGPVTGEGNVYNSSCSLAYTCGNVTHGGGAVPTNCASKVGLSCDPSIYPGDVCCGNSSSPCDTPVNLSCNSGGPITYNGICIGGMASATPTPVVNGSCGSANGGTFVSAPSSGLCSSGTPSAVAGGASWTWTCAGSGSGSPVNCSANRGTGGFCSWNTLFPYSGGSGFNCTAAPMDSCIGSSCTAATAGTVINPAGGCANVACVCECPPIDGVCGSAHGSSVSAAPTSGLCSAGTPSAVAGSGPWTWTCAGISGGTASGTCTANMPASLCWGDPAGGSGTLTLPYRCENYGACATLNTTQGTKCEIDIGGGVPGGPGAGFTVRCINPGGNAAGTPGGCVLDTSGFPCIPDGGNSTDFTCTFGMASSNTFDSSCCTGGSYCDGSQMNGMPALCGGSTPSCLADGATDAEAYCAVPTPIGTTFTTSKCCTNIATCTYDIIGTLTCGGAVPVHAQCGGASGGTYANAAAVNAAGLCNVGTAPAVSGAGPWAWTCTSSGNPANCSANRNPFPAMVAGCPADFSDIGLGCTPTISQAQACCFPDECGYGKGYNGTIVCSQNPDGSWGFSHVTCPGIGAPGMICN